MRLDSSSIRLFQYESERIFFHIDDKVIGTIPIDLARVYSHMESHLCAPASFKLLSTTPTPPANAATAAFFTVASVAVPAVFLSTLLPSDVTFLIFSFLALALFEPTFQSFSTSSSAVNPGVAQQLLFFSWFVPMLSMGTTKTASSSKRLASGA